MRELKRMIGLGVGVFLVAMVMATSGAHAAVTVVVGGELVGATATRDSAKLGFVQICLEAMV